MKSKSNSHSSGPSQGAPPERGGTIEEALPSALFRVKLDDGRVIVAGLSTEARRTLVKVAPGDRVSVSESPFDPTRGKIIFNGRDITRFNRRQMREVRREMQIVFQDPYASLNPRMTVRDIIGEPLRIRGQLVTGGPADSNTRRSYLFVDKTGSLSNPFHNFSDVRYEAITAD